MNYCQNCGREFYLNRMWQKFCCKQCQQKWNKDQYRANNLANGRRYEGGRTSEEMIPVLEKKAADREAQERIFKRRELGRKADKIAANNALAAFVKSIIGNEEQERTPRLKRRF